MASTRKQRRAVRDETPARETVAVPKESLEDLAYQAAHLARATFTRYEVLEARTVRLGREAGLSWDSLGRWLAMPGETLRRRYVGHYVDRYRTPMSSRRLPERSGG